LDAAHNSVNKAFLLEQPARINNSLPILQLVADSLSVTITDSSITDSSITDNSSMSMSLSDDASHVQYPYAFGCNSQEVTEFIAYPGKKLTYNEYLTQLNKLSYAVTNLPAKMSDHTATLNYKNSLC
jgi:hypothetical protein